MSPEKLDETYEVRQIAPESVREASGTAFALYQKVRSIIENEVHVSIGGDDYYAVAQPSGHPAAETQVGDIYLEVRIERA